MPTTDEFKTALVVPSSSARGALYDALSRRNIYVITSGETPTDLVPPPLCTHLCFNGILFLRDDADTTTPHDGTTCIVTSAGTRFKANATAGRQQRRYVVLDKDLTAPPGSPAAGDAYRVATGGTGAFAGRDGQLAQYTARGWLFVVASIYDEMLVLDENLVYHLNASNVWTAGVPGIILPAAGVNIGNLKYGLGLRVFNRTTTVPPASPADGDAYLIPSGATGVWTGHTGKIALRESGAWTLLTPGEGWSVFDWSTATAVYYRSGNWVDPLSLTGKRKLISRVTLSSAVAYVEFLSLAAYRYLFLTMSDVRPSVDAARMIGRLSSDGATFLNTGYAGVIDGFSGGSAYSHVVSGDGLFIDAAATMGNAATDGGLGGSVEIPDFNTNQKTKFIVRLTYGNTAGATVTCSGMFMHADQTTMQAFRLLMSSGNIAAGDFMLEGIE